MGEEPEAEWEEAEAVTVIDLSKPLGCGGRDSLI